MFKQSKRKLDDDLCKNLETLRSAQDDVIFKMQTKKVYEADTLDCSPINFTKAEKLEYMNNVFVDDLTTDEQERLGLNIFHVKIDKTTSSPAHEHESRSQVIFVKEGMIYDKISKIRFQKGESFFISKRNKHSIKYMKGAEVLFIYVPGLKLEEKDPSK